MAVFGKYQSKFDRLELFTKTFGIFTIAAFGVVGEPHIIIRAMAIDSAKHINFARNIKISLGILNSISAIGIGLAAGVLMPDLVNYGDPELALPYLSLELLPAVMVGLILAGFLRLSPPQIHKYLPVLLP